MFALNLKNSLFSFRFVFGAGILLFAFLAITANADLFSYDSSYIPVYSGTTSNLYGNIPNDYDGTIPDDFFQHGFTANLQYAVYHNEAFGMSFPNQYIYAFQIFSHPADPNYDPNVTPDIPNDPNNWNSDYSYFGINDFSIAMNGNSPICADQISGTGNELYAWRCNVQSMRADFYTNSQAIQPGGHSAIIYFTSLDPPTRQHATLTGEGAVNIDDPLLQPFGPSPSNVPEPSTGLLMIAGAIALLFSNEMRRIFK
jgi:hypothetical protein